MLLEAKAELSLTVPFFHVAPAKAGDMTKLDARGAGMYAPLLLGQTAKSRGDLGNRRG